MNYLRVSKLHKIHYEVCGNPKGQALLFVHGGPGAGFSEQDKRFFDFNKYKVVFFDQRGASKSVPFGEIEENTTQHLINDINALLDHLSLEKVILFGSSWGTTLSLVYAIQYPHRVEALLLRGIFLGNQAAIEHYLHRGVAHRFPKNWSRFQEQVPLIHQHNIPLYYLHKMRYGTSVEKKHYAYEWAFYEISIYMLGNYR